MQGHFFSFIGVGSPETLAEFYFCISSLCIPQVSSVVSPTYPHGTFLPLITFFEKAVMEAGSLENTLGRSFPGDLAKQEI